jgi:DNA repair exonuclease SbcCD nuclease subunit
MLKFLHAADIHLDSPLRGLERYEGAPAAEIRAATRRALENLVALAIEEEVAFVLLAGDLYDGDWKDYNTGLFFSAQMARLQEAGIRAFLIAGNHDAASQITKVLRPPPNVRIFSTKRPETEILDELGVAIHGQGFAHTAVSEDLSAGYPAPVPHLFNIGMLHTSLDGRPGHAAYAPCTVAGLRSRGYQYWALGHVHEREVVVAEPWIVFPGNVQGRHARETGAKGATLVTVDDRGKAHLQHRDLDVFRWAVCTVDLTGAAGGDALDRVQRALETALDAADGRPLAARVRLEGACPAHDDLTADPERWINEIRSLATGVGGDLWIEKVQVRTRRAADLAALERDDPEKNALGGLLRTVRELEADDAGLTRLAEGFADLERKLPPELFEEGEAVRPSDPARLRALLEEAKDLLLARLLATPESAEA